MAKKASGHGGPSKSVVTNAGHNLATDCTHFWVIPHQVDQL